MKSIGRPASMSAFEKLDPEQQRREKEQGMAENQRRMQALIEKNERTKALIKKRDESR